MDDRRSNEEGFIHELFLIHQKNSEPKTRLDEDDLEYQTELGWEKPKTFEEKYRLILESSYDDVDNEQTSHPTGEGMEVQKLLHQELIAAYQELKDLNKNMLAANRRSQKYWNTMQSILETVPSAIAIVEASSRISYVNHLGIELLEKDFTGHHLDELRSVVRTLDDPSQPLPSKEWPVNASLQFGAKICNSEVMLQKADRQQVPVLLSSSPILDDQQQITGAVIIFEDMKQHGPAEELRRTQKDLRQSEERFTKIFYHSPAAISIIRMRDRQFIDVNREFLELSEYSREDILGNTLSELGLWPDAEKFEEPWVAELKETGVIRNRDHKGRNKSGNILHCLSSVIVLTIDNEPCYIILTKDITNEKEMEAEIGQLDRLNIIGEMAASIGHEIRNPMTSVRGFLQMLGEKDKYQGDKTFFELMITELDRANSIISEYLSMAKNKELDLQPQSLDIIIACMHPLLMSDANLLGINIELDLCTPPDILIDESEIRQLILNIARNGMEAMESIGKKGTLTIGTQCNNNEVVLYIKDEGPGLPLEIIDAVGHPFVTTKSSGTGLGLSVCYSIAARHNANIDFRTGPSGTTFYVRFPMNN